MKYLPLILLVGCASNLTEGEREWREGIDRENWALCERVYRDQRRPTLHVGHTHKYEGRRPPKIWHVRDDLRTNYCRSVLGRYWVNY